MASVMVSIWERHVGERLLAAKYLSRLHYAYGSLFTPVLMAKAWDEMRRAYQWHICEGVCRKLQARPGGIAREGFRN